jgi:hypothetical protein
MKSDLNIIEAHNWSDLLNAVKDARSLLQCQTDEELWFRGVEKQSYGLLPSLLRCFKLSERTRSKVRGLETDLFFEFLAKARTDEDALTHWDVLFLMQHFRAPTRLLDWTEVFHVALYFAVAYQGQNVASEARIYVLNPYLWNKKHGYDRDLIWPRYFTYDPDEDYFYEYGEILVDDGIDWRYPVALYPPQRNARMSAQRGFFTIHGYDPRPIEKIAPKLVVAIDLDSQAVKEATEALEFSGINESSSFPISRVCRDI